ncbi:MAG: hypothetical protein ACFB0B_19985 [Thermonemataceae bacterium]
MNYSKIINKNTAWSSAAFLATVAMFAGFIVSATNRNYDVNTNMTEPVQKIYLEPAGYAFVIWLFIYVGFVLYGVYQLVATLRGSKAYIKAAPFIILNSFSNIGWFYAVRIDSYLLQIFFIVGMLVTLVAINKYLDLVTLKGRSAANKAIAVFPISIYLGWIAAATPINITFWLARDYGLTSFFLGPVVWSILLVAVSTLLFGFLYFKSLINYYTLGAGIWALVAIGIANLRVALPIGVAAFAGVVMLIALLVLQKFRTLKAVG